MIDKNPYRTLHARMSPPGAAWDEGFAAGQSQAWDSAQVEIDAILASEARPASVGRVVAFLREPRDSTDVNLSLAVAADLIEREFAAGRAAEPEPHESERIAEWAAREAEPNPYRSQDQIVRDEERQRILAQLDSVEAEEAVVNALMAAVEAGADLGSEARAAITALVGLVERGGTNA